MMDDPDIVIKDRLGLGATCFDEYAQRLLECLQRVPVIPAVQVYPAQVVEGLGFAAPVADGAVDRQRVQQVRLGLGIPAQVPAGNPGVAQGARQAALVRSLLVEEPRLVEVGQGLPGPGRALMRDADLVQGVGLAGPVGQRPVDRRGLLGRPAGPWCEP
jgi:hypothetical protein